MPCFLWYCPVLAAYVASGASAAGYVYALAIQTAFANCDLSQTKGDINQVRVLVVLPS
jgi:hypothetical protein